MKSMSMAMLAAAMLLGGCGGPAPVTGAKPVPAAVAKAAPEADDVSAERAKLPAEERAEVDAQEWCAINQDGRLGSMGAPIKLMLKGKPVYLCCKGCKRKAESDPDGTLAAVELLKAKAQALKGGKS